MTRRAAAGLARLLPVLLIATAVVVVAGAALLVACSGSSGGASPAPTATVTVTASGTAEPSTSPSASAPADSSETTLRLYFLRGEQFGVAERRVPHTTMPATAAIKALLAGPTAADQAAGLSSSIAPGTKLNSLSIAAGVAHVDLSPEIWSSGEDLAGTDSLLPGAQIVYTLTRFPTVRRVVIRVNDEPYVAAGSADSPSTRWRRSDFRTFEPNIFVETPGVGAVISSPFLLSGTARVFEGAFQARLIDSSGRRVVNVLLQASRGAPGRGRFARDVPFSTSAKRGTLIVFDLSMEDGSRLDEVRIPVVFSTP